MARPIGSGWKPMWRRNPKARGRYQWHVRTTDPATGRRVWVPLDHRIPETEPERALECARTTADYMRATSSAATPPAEGETVAQWFERWIDSRRGRKSASTVRADEGRFRKWVSPMLGRKNMRAVQRREVEEVVQHLDAAVRRDEMRWKTAINVWGVVSKMFKDAARSKILDLRVRDDNPAREVEGPDRGTERSGPYLFPSEFELLMRCDRVPVRWKRIFMLATYTYTRAGELEALEWNSVNFERGYVHVHQAVDQTGGVKSTKTKDTRKVPIERALLPLLWQMHGEAGGTGRVVTAMPPLEERAARLRKYLEWAGVDRADIFAHDATRRPLTFHDLRHTGITWRAVRGDEPLKVQRAAGHDDLRTTQRYINEAQTFEGEAFGDPFPAVPMSLLTRFSLTPVVSARKTHEPPVFPVQDACPQRESKTPSGARNHW